MDRIFRPKKLITKLSLAVLFAMTFAVTMQFGFLQYVYDTAQNKFAHVQYKRVASALSHSLVTPLKLGDKHSVEGLIMQRLKVSEGILDLSITDQEGDVVFEYHDNALTHDSYQSPHLLTITLPIQPDNYLGDFKTHKELFSFEDNQPNNVPIGTIEMRVVYERHRLSAQEGMLYALFVLVPLLTLIAFVFAIFRSFYRRGRLMGENIECIKQGNYQQLKADATGDELSMINAEVIKLGKQLHETKLNSEYHHESAHKAYDVADKAHADRMIFLSDIVDHLKVPFENVKRTLSKKRDEVSVHALMQVDEMYDYLENMTEMYKDSRDYPINNCEFDIEVELTKIIERVERHSSHLFGAGIHYSFVQAGRAETKTICTDIYRFRQLVELTMDYMVTQPVKGEVSVNCTYNVIDQEQRKYATIEITHGNLTIPKGRLLVLQDFFEGVESIDAKDYQEFGAGLAIVANIASALGANISLRALPQRGISFVVDVPSHNAESQRGISKDIALLDVDRALAVDSPSKIECSGIQCFEQFDEFLHQLENQPYRCAVVYCTDSIQGAPLNNIRTVLDGMEISIPLIGVLERDDDDVMKEALNGYFYADELKGSLCSYVETFLKLQSDPSYLGELTLVGGKND